jgi:hypothetical protein
MIAAPCVATGIVEHVSKNPVCRAHLVVRVEAESLHARPTVVLEKSHLNIASRPGLGLHLLRHLAIVPASTNLYVPTEPYGDVVSLMWQDGAQRLRRTGTHTHTDTLTHKHTDADTQTHQNSHSRSSSTWVHGRTSTKRNMQIIESLVATNIIKKMYMFHVTVNGRFQDTRV